MASSALLLFYFFSDFYFLRYFKNYFSGNVRIISLQYFKNYFSGNVRIISIWKTDRSYMWMYKH